MVLFYLLSWYSLEEKSLKSLGVGNCFLWKLHNNLRVTIPPLYNSFVLFHFLINYEVCEGEIGAWFSKYFKPLLEFDSIQAGRRNVTD